VYTSYFTRTPMSCLLCLGSRLFIGLQSTRNQGRSQKFILGGYNFLLHDTTVLYTSSLTTSAAISAQNNFQGLILGGYIYRYTPRRYDPASNALNDLHVIRRASFPSCYVVHCNRVVSVCAKVTCRSQLTASTAPHRARLLTHVACL